MVIGDGERRVYISYFSLPPISMPNNPGPSQRRAGGQASHSANDNPGQRDIPLHLGSLAQTTSLNLSQVVDSLPDPPLFRPQPALSFDPTNRSLGVTMSPEEEAELIELVALHFSTTERQAQCFGGRFASNRAFRDKVLQADQMYRSRKTLIDYHHAGCLREAVCIHSPSRDWLRFFTPDEQLTYICRAGEQAKDNLDRDQNATDELLLSQFPQIQSTRGLLTGVDGNPTHQDALELTTTPAGARVAAAQYAERRRRRQGNPANRPNSHSSDSNAARMSAVGAAAAAGRSPETFTERTVRGRPEKPSTDARAAPRSGRPEDSSRSSAVGETAANPSPKLNLSSSASRGARQARAGSHVDDKLWKGMFDRKK